MSFTLSQLFPGIETGLNRIGFLFGAGTSKEAGYPLMGDLTKTVISNLRQPLKESLAQVRQIADFFPPIRTIFGGEWGVEY